MTCLIEFARVRRVYFVAIDCRLRQGWSSFVLFWFHVFAKTMSYDFTLRQRLSCVFSSLWMWVALDSLH